MISLPQAFDGLRIVGVLVAEHMRMPANEFRGDGLDHVAEVEGALFLRHAGVKDDLQQQIAELVLKVVEIVARDRVGDLVGFLERIRRDASRSFAPGPTGSRSWASATPP